MTKLLHTSRLAMCLILLLSATAVSAAKLPKLTGANGLKFGWTLEKCVETVGDVPRKMTTGTHRNLNFHAILIPSIIYQ
ncbi:hypothetical protein, partial [uncultured Muribaculum sp.]|uniref:hypothetical protein n=1 Tax=uncultured Muribaculum sp. TaxID=1918613 RepID=UPI00266F03B6